MIFPATWVLTRSLNMNCWLAAMCYLVIYPLQVQTCCMTLHICKVMYIKGIYTPGTAKHSICLTQYTEPSQQMSRRGANPKSSQTDPALPFYEAAVFLYLWDSYSEKPCSLFPLMLRLQIRARSGPTCLTRHQPKGWVKAMQLEAVVLASTPSQQQLDACPTDEKIP